MNDIVPKFQKSDKKDVAITNLSAFSASNASKTSGEIVAICLVAIVVVGSMEVALRLFEVKSYILPKPSEIFKAYYTYFGLVLPHLGHTLAVLLMGFSIGSAIGLILAALITQFPFAEKIIAPYILILVTTPMLALVPLLILRFGFGYSPRVIAVALAAGPMVMINSATGFRRVDSAKIALARSYGASTLQIFWKIRAPMALPMILVGLMIGAIFGLLTAVGAEMVGGGFGLGNRLTTYSSMIQMPQFFAVVLMLSALGILIYVIFFLLGKKFASWEP